MDNSSARHAENTYLSISFYVHFAPAIVFVLSSF